MSIINTRVTSCLIIVALLLVSSTSFAEKWLDIGPLGGDVVALSAHPDQPERLFASVASNGLFVSEDSGANWSKLPSFGNRQYFSAITIAPSDKNIIYARSAIGDEIFRSDDAGQNWQLKSTGLPTQLSIPENFPIVAINPLNSQHLVIVIADVLYQTLNGGDTWSLLGAPVIDSSDSAISQVTIVATATDNRIVVSVLNESLNSEGVYLKSKNDDSWVNISPTNQSGFSGVLSRGDGNGGSLLIAFGLDGLWFSSDLGSSWALKDTGLIDCEVHGIPCDEADKGVQVSRVVFDLENPQILYAYQQGSPSLWKTLDQGANWSYVNSDRTVRVLLPLSSDNLYIGDASDGVFFSANEGVDWQAKSNGLKSGSIADVAVHPLVDRQVLISSFQQGVLETLNNGLTWDAKNFGLIPSDLPDNFDNAFTSVIHPEHLWMDQDDPSLMLVNNSFIGISNGLFRTTSGGESWTQITSGLPDPLFVSNIIRSNGATPTIYLASPFDGLYQSTDNGLNWQKIGPTSVNLIKEMALNSAGDIFVVARETINDDNKLWISTNNGVSFTSLAVNADASLENVFSYNGLPGETLSAIFVTTDVELDANLNTIKPSKLFRSTDKGQNWQKMSFTNERGVVTSVAFDPIDQNIVYLGTGLTITTEGEHLFKSIDNGSNFVAVGGNAEPLDIRHIKVNPNNTSEIYLSTYSGGLYKSNLLPSININAPSQAAQGSSVTLDASDSRDREGDIATFLWQQTDGVEVSLTGESTAIVQFVAPNEEATLQFKLTVTDQQGESSEQVVALTVTNNQLPIVNINAPEVVNYLENVLLDASSSNDPDGDIISYLWTQTAGFPVTLTDLTAAAASFDAPNEPGNLTFLLVISDNENGETQQTVSMRVNQPPEVTLANSMSALSGANVEISAAINDLDGSVDTIEWSQTSGSSVSLNNADTSSVSFTAPTQATTIVLTLSVADSDGGVAQKQISINVAAAVPPPGSNDLNNSGGGGAFLYLVLLLLPLARNKKQR